MANDELQKLVGELRALEAKATPGEWEVSDGAACGFEGSFDVVGSDNCGIASMAETAQVAKFPRDVEANAALIAAMRNALPSLLSALDSQARVCECEAVVREAENLLASPGAGKLHETAALEDAVDAYRAVARRERESTHK